jgi:hypothetical protein
MDTKNNHYEFLGLDVASPPDRVRAAVDRMAQHANTIAHTSPDRSHALWERIRQIRADLLSDPGRRQAYDLALIRALTPEEPVAKTASPAPQPAARPRVSVRPARPVTAAPWQPPALPMAGLAAALLAAVAVALFLFRPTSAGTHRSAPVALREQGSFRRHAYLPNHPVTLAWSALRGATQYRVEVASGAGKVEAPNAFDNPQIVRVLRGQHITLTVHGGLLYAWRVQGFVGGQWQPFSSARVFYVSRPQPAEVAVRPVATPRPSRPRASHTRSKHSSTREHAHHRTAHRSAHRSRTRVHRSTSHRARRPTTASAEVAAASGRSRVTSTRTWTPPVQRRQTASVRPAPAARPAASVAPPRSRPPSSPPRPPRRTPPAPPPAPRPIPTPTVHTYPFGYGRPAVGPPGPPGIVRPGG